MSRFAVALGVRVALLASAVDASTAPTLAGLGGFVKVEAGPSASAAGNPIGYSCEDNQNYEGARECFENKCPLTGVSTVEACARHCNATEGCAVIVHNTRYDHCYLKSDYTESLPDDPSLGTVSCATSAGKHPPPQPLPFDTEVAVDLTSPTTAFEHYWKKSFGSGHASLTLRPNWQAHLKLAVEQLGLSGVRYHGLLDDDMGVVIGPGKYNFSKVIASWKYQKSLGVTPIVETSFMPAVLAGCSWKDPNPPGKTTNPTKPSCKHTGMEYRGVQEVPTDWSDWYDLVKALTQAAVDTFGIEEIRTWSFECWNELWGMPFPSTYMALFNQTACAIKAVDPAIKVGGPATAQLLNVKQFHDLATAGNIPFDFVSTHIYPTDPQLPKGEYWNPSGMADHVKAARASVPGKPFYLTEYNVGCCVGYQGHDTSASAAFAFRTIPALDGVVDILSWWSFTDDFQQDAGSLPTKEYSGIYGLMTYHGVPKPGWRGFELMAAAGDHRVNATLGINTAKVQQHEAEEGKCVEEKNMNMAGFTLSTVKAPTKANCCSKCRAVDQQHCSFWTFHDGECVFKSSDAGRTKAVGYASGSRVVPDNSTAVGSPLSVFATVNASAATVDTLQVFLSLWGNPSLPGVVKPRTVKVTVTHAVDEANAPKSVVAWYVDATHSDSLSVWKKQGSPAVPSATQLAELMTASEIKSEPVKFTTSGGSTVVDVPMTENSAVRLNFA
jgi:xylan 1,4-beta-xylosidase